MSKPGHDRYAFDAQGTLCVDVAADKVEDLYNNYDRNSPFIRRDLDADLVDYLIDCASEINPQPFVIRFSFNKPHDAETHTRIHRSINNFFLYMVSQEQHLVRRMFYRSGVFLVLGLLILLVSLLVNRAPVIERSVLVNLFAEGLNIAAWVSMWEALATVLVDWFVHRRQINLYRKLAWAKLLFGENTKN